MSDSLRRYRSMVSDSGRWDGFTFRADDIVISTPSKCGTTWLQMICALLIFQSAKLPRPLTELAPWVDIQTDTVENVFAALEAQKHRRFIKTHTPLDGLPYDERVTYVCLGRDPRDVAISWDNHRSNMNVEAVLEARAAAVGSEGLIPAGTPPRAEDPVERFWHWIEDDVPAVETIGLGPLLHHLGTFWDQRGATNILLLHYADLQSDLEGEMRQLAASLGIEIDTEVWPALVAAATFDRMRDRADELAPQVKVDGFWIDNSRFFHCGSSGQWRSFLNPEDLARYEARVGRLAAPDLANWVHRGWRAFKG